MILSDFCSNDLTYMNTYLNDYDLNSDEFLNLINQNNGIIAGSFPLQILLEEKYEGSDIDIFFKDIIYNTGTAPYNLFPEIEKYLYTKFHVNHKVGEYIINDILRSKKYVLPKITINIIYTSVEPLDFIFNSFDFSMCQTFIMNNILYYNNMTLNKIGYLVNPITIPKKLNYYHKEINNYDIVIVNNNTIQNNLYPLNIYEHLKQKLEYRTKKYINRGFKIINECDVSNNMDNTLKFKFID